MALSVGLTLGACGDDGGGAVDDGADTDDGTEVTGDEGDPTTGEPSLDGTTTGDVDPPPPEIMWEFEDVYGVPNLDDDDENGQLDWNQLLFPAEDDHSIIALPVVSEGHSIELTVAGPMVDQARLWFGESGLVGSGDGEVIETATFALPADEPGELAVEFRRDYVGVALTLRLLGPDDQEVARDDILLRSAPAILNHHLQPTEHVWVVDVDAGFGSNASMVADYQSALGGQFTAVPGNQYEFDVWIQDELQVATSTGSQGQRIDTVIDSIRDRGLDDFPEEVMLGPGVNIRTWGNPSQVTTWDSFGNLENSPPVSVDGTDYPFGRIYYGKNDSRGIHEDMADYLVSQDVQAPVELDTFWLCVGHVDEFMTFVPDPESDKGFKLLYADVDVAYELLDGLEPETPLGLYGPDHSYPTVGSIVDDVALRNLNEDLQADELDPMLDVIMTEFGLEESDVVRMPSLFETVGGCGGGTAALIPGMVNLVVANTDDGSHLFIPDPFFRDFGEDRSFDPVIEAFTNSLPPSLIPHYVDDWDVYHLALGEVHCGTNMTRTPTDHWWEVALHLLGG